MCLDAQQGLTWDDSLRSFQTCQLMQHWLHVVQGALERATCSGGHGLALCLCFLVLASVLDLQPGLHPIITACGCLLPLLSGHGAAPQSVRPCTPSVPLSRAFLT